MEKLEADLRLLNSEIIRVSGEKFTGKIDVTIHMNQGGIGQISVNIAKNLKNSVKTEGFKKSVSLSA